MKEKEDDNHIIKEPERRDDYLVFPINEREEGESIRRRLEEEFGLRGVLLCCAGTVRREKGLAIRE